MNEALPQPMLDCNKQTGEICRLFSSTLQSLAADAKAIRQLSSLSDCLFTSHDEENCRPNIREHGENRKRFGDSGSFQKDNNTIICDEDDESSHLAQLRKLDQAVASIEQKVLALRSIVSEEKKAISLFEGSLREECEAQQLAIKNLMQAHQEIRIKTEKVASVSSEKEHRFKLAALSARTANSERTEPKFTTSYAPITAVPQESQETSNNIEIKNKQQRRKRRDSVDPRADHSVQPAKHNQGTDDNRVSFLPVTEKEISRISRNTRGRINLLDLNEALEEIEYVAEKKFDSIPRHASFSSASRQRRFEYLRQQRGSSYEQIEVKAHQGHYWVSEQELRESCAFFRNGESTARAILSILCSLRRLKQIPGKKRQVTYLCLVYDNTDLQDVHHC